MRVVGGSLKGRRLEAPRGRDIRPTSDRMRQAIFNILEHSFGDFELTGAAVLDLFAGTGALGLEALSRGAAHVTFIDVDPDALSWLKRNVSALGVMAQATVLKLDAARLPPPPLVVGAPCRLAFLDPPYDSGLAAPALAGLAARGWIGEGSLCVAELAAGETFQPPAGFEVVDERTYGSGRVVFLVHSP